MRNITKRKLRKAVDASSFIAPALIFISITTLIPFIMNLSYSFTNWNGISKAVEYIGLQNFIELFKDGNFFSGSVLFTLKYAVLYVVFVNIFALAMAFLLVKNLKTKNMLRAMLYIPNIISLIVVGYIWKFILGMGFDSLFDITGLSFFQMSWLGDSHMAFWTILLVSIWQVAGFYSVIYIAGLQSIPEDILEASKIDGAYGFRRFFKIILPMIMPSVTVCLFTSILNALKVFEIPFVLTNGGPFNSTTSISMDIYNEAFVNNLYGYGTAKSVLFFAMIFIFTMLQLRYSKRKEVEL